MLSKTGSRQLNLDATADVTPPKSAPCNTACSSIFETCISTLHTEHFKIWPSDKIFIAYINQHF